MSMIDIGDHAASLQETVVADYRVLSDEELDQVTGGHDSGSDPVGDLVEALKVVFSFPRNLGRKIGEHFRECPEVSVE